MTPHKKTLRRACILPLIALVVTLTGCAIYSNGNFEPYSGPSVFTGHGGSKRTVNGIDVWDSGSPPGQFRILGYIFQRNLENGSVMSVIASFDTMNEITKQAKLVGGDAIIFEAQNTQTTGYSGNVDYYGNFDASATTMTNSRIAVIKYLP